MSSPGKLAFLAALVLVIGLAIAAAAAFALRQGGTAFAGSSLIDSDFDGCNDAEEVVLGLDPNNFFDFPDVAGPQGSRNPDGVINALDSQSVAFRWGTEAGDQYYDVYFDRHDGTGANGPNGAIDIYDLQLMFGRFGTACQGVPAPDLDEVCLELEAEAATEGVDEFECSEDPLPDHVAVADVDIKKRIVQVTTLPDSAVDVQGLEVEMNAEPETVPPSSVKPGAEMAGSEGEAASFHPSACDNVVCDVTLSYRGELRHFRGHGPNCAWFKFEQKYKVYRPWIAIFEVRNPVVSSGAWFPCNEEDRESWIERSGIPLWAESGASIEWKIGIPTPWGTIGVRTFHPSVSVWFNGLYETDWTY